MTERSVLGRLPCVCTEERTSENEIQRESVPPRDCSEPEQLNIVLQGYGKARIDRYIRNKMLCPALHQSTYPDIKKTKN